MIIKKEELKKDLKQIASLRIEIAELEKKIKKLEKDKYAIINFTASSKHFPYTKHNYKKNVTEPKVIKKINCYRDNILVKEEKLKNKLFELEKFIDGLPTSRLRLIFQYKYIDQYTWRKIAFKIGGNSTEESVRKEHDRFLNKIESLSVLSGIDNI